MAQFNQSLQSQVGGASVSPAPSATNAIAGVAAQFVDTVSGVMDADREAKIAAQEQLQGNLLGAKVQELAEGWSARSGNPVKAEAWLMQNVSSLRSELPASQFSDVAKDFKAATGRSLYRSQSDMSKEINDQEQVTLEMQQRNAQDIQYAFWYQATSPEAAALFTPEGSLREGVTAEQAANVGRGIRLQQEGQLAVLQNQASIAKSQEERETAEAKVRAFQLKRMITGALADFEARMDVPAGGATPEELDEFDALYNNFTLQIGRAGLLNEDMKGTLAGLESSYTILRDRMSGKAEADRRTAATQLRAAQDFNTIAAASPEVRLFMQMNAMGARISDSLAQAVETQSANLAREQAVGNPNASGTGDDIPTTNGKGIAYQRAVTENFVGLGSPSRPPSNETETEALRNHYTIGLNPVTSEQRNNFYGKDGLYLNLLQKWSSDKVVLDNLSPSVLNTEDVRGAFIQRNLDAIPRYLQRVMSGESWKNLTRSEVVNVDSSKGYPVLSVRRDEAQRIGRETELRLAAMRGPSIRRGVPSFPELWSLDQLNKDVENINRLFRLQYEATLNYGEAIGDSDMAKDLAFSQRFSLSQYGLVKDERVSALEGMQ